ncbi:MAG: hypothetical protein RLP44_08850 [Aggregatilineales bacterium]
MVLSSRIYERMLDWALFHYADQVYFHNDIWYPTVFFPADASQRDNPDSLLAPVPPTEFVDIQDFAFYADTHLALRRSQRRQLSNGLCYIFDTLTTDDNKPQLSARLGNYFDMMATCDALDEELEFFSMGGAPILPLRSQLHEWLKSEGIRKIVDGKPYDGEPYDGELYDGRGRCGVIGTATLTVFNHEGTYKFLMAQRSPQLATGAGMYHVLPAFVFQPTRNHPAWISAEWGVTHHILREFGEELFGMPEYADWSPAPPDPTYFYDHPPVKELRAMLNDGRAQLQATGIAQMLRSLRPEICTLLIIHDPAWYTRNEPALHAAMHTERQETRLIPLDSLNGLPDDIHLRMVAQGATAMWEGVKLARKILTR